MDRRTFLTAASAATLTAAAGCLGSDPTDDPESVVTEYYELLDDVESVDDFEDFGDDVEDIAHSASPIPDFFDDEAEFDDDEFEEESIESIETEVLEEDVGEDELREEYGLAFFLEDEEIETVAEENTVVEATVETNSDEDEDEPAEHVVATEDGDWLMVV